ncbi:MAG: hypothetical protein ACRBN8_22460 [Nannocystales bacterium]
MQVNSGDESGDTGESNTGDGSGDTGSGSNTQAGGGDTSTGDDSDSGDTEELEQLRAKVAEQDAKIQDLKKDKDNVTRDRDDGIRKRKSLGERLAALEESNKKAEEKIAKAERRDRISATTDAILGELHADHQGSKTAKRVVNALQAEGLDFSTEDRAPIVAKAVEILKSDNPDYFEKRTQERMPVLPKTKNGKVKTEGQGGVRDKKGERLF